MWLGLRARRKLELLEMRLEQIEREWRAVDLEVTNALDKFAGIAKRFTGRASGGRPPNKPDSNSEETETPWVNRHAE